MIIRLINKIKQNSKKGFGGLRLFPIGSFTFEFRAAQISNLKTFFRFFFDLSRDEPHINV